MKVKELIAILETKDPTFDVQIWSDRAGDYCEARTVFADSSDGTVVISMEDC